MSDKDEKAIHNQIQCDKTINRKFREIIENTHFLAWGFFRI